MRFRSVLLALPVACGGCAYGSIEDLALWSVQAVDRYDQAELGTREHEPLLKVEFTSLSDLSKFPAGDNVDHRSGYCDRPNAPVAMWLPGIYAQGQRIEPLRSAAWEDEDRRLATPAIYYIFFRVAGEERPYSKPAGEAFDLRNQPEDVCFYLEGGSYRALGYASNIVKIQKDLIAVALSNPPAIPAR